MKSSLLIMWYLARCTSQQRLAIPCMHSPGFTYICDSLFIWMFVYLHFLLILTCLFNFLREIILNSFFFLFSVEARKMSWNECGNE